MTTTTSFPLDQIKVVLLENIRYDRREDSKSADDRAAAQRALSAVDLAGLEQRDIATLSGGERRRLSIATILAQTFPVTIRLAILALLFEMIFGIGIGLVSGLRKGKLFDNSALVMSLIFISLPIFVIAFVFQFFFAIRALTHPNKYPNN